MPFCVACSPDKYCVVTAYPPPPGHRPVSEVFKTQQEAVQWRATHPAQCKLFPPVPQPGVPPDFVCS